MCLFFYVGNCSSLHFIFLLFSISHWFKVQSYQLLQKSNGGGVLLAEPFQSYILYFVFSSSCVCQWWMRRKKMEEMFGIEVRKKRVRRRRFFHVFAKPVWQVWQITANEDVTQNIFTSFFSFRVKRRFEKISFFNNFSFERIILPGLDWIE